MDYINIEKKANCYTVEINSNWRDDDSEDELFFYKTREEMEADLPNVIKRAHEKHEEEQAEIAAKKVN